MLDAGRAVPALEDRPTATGFVWLWEAFIDLGTCRQVGMAAGPIPWTAIQRYAEVNRFGEDETWMLHGVVRHLDSLWLKNNAKAVDSSTRK